ncbi:MAG: metal ABC transporter permease, partial [Chloroflexi bacterium]|nr:metal ABC transporter permease [Chloroflexota bacterium]
RINGVRVHALNIGLAVITGATITLSMRVVGVLLIGALIVVPVLIALRLSTGLTRTVVTASVVGMFTAVTGMVISFYADVAPGGAVVLTGIGLLVLVELANRARRIRRGHRLASEIPHTHAHTIHAHARAAVKDPPVGSGVPSNEESPRPAGTVLLADDEPKA